MSETYRGRCLCGGVAFEINGPVENVHACHCGQCRRQSGHFVAGASTERENFRLLNDETLAWYQSSDFARRGFCSTCGSNLFWDDSGDTANFNMGVLDQPTGLRLANHIFVADKADYYDIDDDLPKFDQGAGE